MVAKATPSSTPEGLWAELEALPETVKGEIIKGTLYTQPRPLPRHQDIGAAIVGDLRGAYQRSTSPSGGADSREE